jgi:hypothetical protein
VYSHDFCSPCSKQGSVAISFFGRRETPELDAIVKARKEAGVITDTDAYSATSFRIKAVLAMLRFEIAQDSESLKQQIDPMQSDLPCKAPSALEKALKKPI